MYTYIYIYIAPGIAARSAAFPPNHKCINLTPHALQCFQNNGRVCVCGSISEYDDKWAGQTQWNMILMRRLTVSGFICMDHMNEFGEATAELSQLVKEGKVKYAEDVREGIEGYIGTVKLLLSGANEGKLILKL